MILVIVVLAVIGMVGILILRESVEIYVSSAREREVRGAARLGLDRMTREIRELDAGSMGEATPSAVSFTNPYNTRLTGGPNLVRFRLSGTTLERSGDGGARWEPLVENVANGDIFTYYKFEEGSARAFIPKPSCDDVQWVRIKLEVTGPDRTATLGQQVSLMRGRR